MKKLLYIFILLPLFVIGQTTEDWNYHPQHTAYNMSVLFLTGTLSNFAGDSIKAYAVKYIYAGPADHLLGIPPIDSIIVPTSWTWIIEEDGSVGIPVFGWDNLCNCNVANNGDLIRFFIRSGEGDDIVFVQVNVFPELTYITNGVTFYDFQNISFSIDGNPVVFGCTDDGYLEFDSSHNLDDGSCATIAIWGCTDEASCNYNDAANIDDESCEYPQDFYDCEGNCLSDMDVDGVCDELEIPGCQDSLYLEYNTFATEDDSSCNTLIVYGCTYSFALNFNSLANVNDGSCLVEGCTDSEAINYDSIATNNDSSCVYFSPIVYQLVDNWNIVGFTAADTVQLGNTMAGKVQALIDVIDPTLGSGTTTSTFQVIKNVSGQFWSEAVSLLHELVPGEGYQMYVKPGNSTTINFSETFVRNIEYQLIDNWNMVGFTAPDTILFGNSMPEKIQGLIDVMDLAIDGNTIETFQVIKNVSGQFWSETASLLGGLIPGEGYQMYVKPGNATTINFYQEE